MNQMALSFEREAGAAAGGLCSDKAARVAGFDSDGAGRFILSWLRRHGPTSGEDLTDAAMDHGFRPHDSRAFGPVYATLARSGLIRCVGFCARKRGHGTAGGRIWGVAQ